MTSAVRRSSAPARAVLCAAVLVCLPGAAHALTLFGLLDTGELYASADGGVNWAIRSTLPVRDAVALVAGATSSELLMASERGSFYRSTDAGNNWTAVGAIPASDVSALVGFQGRYLLLTASGSVYSSTDAGATSSPEDATSAVVPTCDSVLTAVKLAPASALS